MLSLIIPLLVIVPQWVTAVVNYGLTDRVSGCNDPTNSIGVYNEFGVDLEKRLVDMFGYVKEQPSALSMPLVIGTTDYTYHRLHLKRDKNFVYTLVKVSGGTGSYGVLDQVRINPLNWQTFSNAILSTGSDAIGRPRTQYLMSDCTCRARVMTLEGMKTTACKEGSDLAEDDVLPYCQPDSGIIAFYGNPIQSFTPLHARHPKITTDKFTLHYGKCNTDIFDASLPIYCLGVSYDGVVLEYIRVPPAQDETFDTGVYKGQDYAALLATLLLKTGQLGHEVLVQYLMKDCTCRARTYLVAGGAAAVTSDQPCYQFTPETGKWLPPQ